MNWIVTKDEKKFLEVLDTFNLNVKVVPNDYILTDEDSSLPNLQVYGSLGLYRNNKNVLTNLLELDKFDERKVIKDNEGHVYFFNNDFKFIKLSEVSLDKGERVFIKPRFELKLFTGKVIDKTGLRKLKRTYPPSTEVCIASHKKIINEHRLFFVNNKLVTHSCYWRNNKTSLIHANFKEYIRSLRFKNMPKNFVVDVVSAFESDDNPYYMGVLELNPFNFADFYTADMDKFVEKLVKSN